jgi:mannosyl-3-phosphoglycerate phosphatase family protein
VITPPPALLITDIDGTVLDSDSYRLGPSRSAIRALQTDGIPVVFCSTRSRAEQEALRADLGISDPYVVENGAAVIMPAGSLGNADDEVAGFGLSFSEVRHHLMEAARRSGVDLCGYADLTVDEVAARTGLDPVDAARAQRREYSETAWVKASPAQTAGFRRAAEGLGLRMVAGRHGFTFSGSHDKGTGVRYLLDRYPPVATYAVGDAVNDLPMFEAVGKAFQVQRPDGTWAEPVPAKVTRVPAPGPDGFAMAVKAILEELKVPQT